ncbi:hypothetical protein I79_018275 [Cricetulus griseus]|uniref:Uncharacterized protein n=1 Tax=Cricetulus griseus TaxID=10029 RepID=G3I499_CRIGR|nr:hypothetical protein I79_018275 [Cricetulus griseus]
MALDSWPCSRRWLCTHVHLGSTDFELTVALGRVEKWLGGLELKRVRGLEGCCSSQGPGFGSQHPHQAAHNHL